MYLLLSEMWNAHSDCIAAQLSLSFVSGIREAFDGEADPRNLSILFPFLSKVLIEYGSSLEKEAEDVFESVCVYFPIYFKPPPDDPIGIRPEELESHLMFVANNLYLVFSYFFLNFSPVPPFFSKIQKVTSKWRNRIFLLQSVRFFFFGLK